MISARPTRDLVLVSLLGLFLEMMLIRWVGTEVRIFAYLQNTILVVCFLGLGLGAFWSRQPARRGLAVLPVAVFAALLAIPWTRDLLRGVADKLAPLSGSVAWSFPSGASAPMLVFDLIVGLVVMTLLLMVICVGMVPIGQALGRLLDEARDPIAAYSWNVAASLVGIWGFALLSALYLPPAVWIGVAGVLLVPFLWGHVPRWSVVVLIPALVALGFAASWEPAAEQVWWSPYQKLALERVARVPDDPAPVGHVWVNNTGYQAMLDLRPVATRARPDLYTEDWHGLTRYDLPGLLHDRPRNVLIAGAGTGNDAAAALRNGAEHVVAVEIDPAIVRIGKQFHPEAPYADDRVEVVVDDARSFFANDTRTFDLVTFGLLDAHTMTALSNARLDHYVYTRESIAQAHDRLAPDGLLTLSFAARHPYIIDRLATTLRDEFGRDPMVFIVPASAFGFGAVVFVAGNLEMAKARIGANPRLTRVLAGWEAVERSILPFDGKSLQEWLPHRARVASDDWPYLYLERPTIPLLFFLLGLLVLWLPFGVRRVLRAPSIVQERWGREHWHFAALGAAFLLLEVQNISKASVVLGNTWLVSAVIITGVLVMVLIANLIVSRVPRLPLLPVGGVLLATCLALYFVDLSALLVLPWASRAAVVAALTCLPMLFGGILFIRSFATTSRRDEAFGANLLGSLAGGLLQSVSYLTGVRFLLLLVVAFYVLALLTRPIATRPAEA